MDHPSHRAFGRETFISSNPSSARDDRENLRLYEVFAKSGNTEYDVTTGSVGNDSLGPGGCGGGTTGVNVVDNKGINVADFCDGCSRGPLSTVISPAGQIGEIVTGIGWRPALAILSAGQHDARSPSEDWGQR